MGFEEKRIVVAVIGPARCGKSALIRALGNSDAKASHAKQVGDDNRHFAGRRATGDGSVYSVELVDTKATSEFSRVRALAIGRADVLCLVYTEDSKIHLADKWYPDVWHYTGGKKPIVVVATKGDIPHPSVIMKHKESKRSAFALSALQRMARRPVVLCSATEGTGIEELRTALVEAHFAGPPDAPPAHWCRLL